MYEVGEGLEKDVLTAYAWYKAAADEGHEQAIQDYRRLTKSLTTEELAASEAIRLQLPIEA